MPSVEYEGMWCCLVGFFNIVNFGGPLLFAFLLRKYEIIYLFTKQKKNREKNQTGPNQRHFADNKVCVTPTFKTDLGREETLLEKKKN